MDKICILEISPSKLNPDTPNNPLDIYLKVNAELKDIDGNDVPFTQLAAFNAMANDLNFLNVVTDLSFDRNRFG